MTHASLADARNRRRAAAWSSCAALVASCASACSSKSQDSINVPSSDDVDSGATVSDASPSDDGEPGSTASGEGGGGSGTEHDGGLRDANGGTEAGAKRDAGSCPAPATAVDAQASAALALINETRSLMGSPCMTMVSTLNTAAAKHCTYFAANFAMNPSFTANMCIAQPHYEVMGCTDFVGHDPATREMAAGYSLANGGGGEDMDFLGNGSGAVQDWINSVYHRTDVLGPWTGDVGYGSAQACDTLDFGIGHTGASTSLVVTYPYDGETSVPLSFDGGREEPTPAVPPAGWPSGYPVTVYLQGVTLTTHEFSVDGGAPIDHQWLTAQTDTNLQYANSAVLYGNAPLTHATRYRVHVAGTRNGSPVDVNFTFTTQ